MAIFDALRHRGLRSTCRPQHPDQPVSFLDIDRAMFENSLGPLRFALSQDVEHVLRAIGRKNSQLKRASRTTSWPQDLRNCVCIDYISTTDRPQQKVGFTSNLTSILLRVDSNRGSSHTVFINCSQDLLLPQSVTVRRLEQHEYAHSSSRAYPLELRFERPLSSTILLQCAVIVSPCEVI